MTPELVETSNITATRSKKIAKITPLCLPQYLAKLQCNTRKAGAKEGVKIVLYVQGGFDVFLR